MIIAIDGPAGSGKSTISRKLAQKLEIMYLDTGAMYRALTLKAKRAGVDFASELALERVAGEADIRLKFNSGDGSIEVYLDGENVTEAIREPELTNDVKHVAALPQVRQIMVQLQRHMADSGGLIAEGRDIGTVVFPDADFKFYIDAALDERAQRRFKELTAAGCAVEYESVKKNLILRDDSDKNRKAGPLKKAKDAVMIDTTAMSVPEVLKSITDHIERAGK